MVDANINISETKAVALAKQWLENKIGENYPVSSTFLVPETKAGKGNDYIHDMPARWVIVFKASVSKSIEPNQIGVEINQETGEITSMPM